MARATRQATSLWRETFGLAATTKEDGLRKVTTAGTGRTLAATHAGFKRALEAYRANAPGNWSDNRLEQTQHFKGISYVAIHRMCEQFQQAEFQVWLKDESIPEGKRPVSRTDPPQGGRECVPYDLVELLEKPNNDDSFGDWLYMLLQQMLLTGTALTWMVPNSYDNPCPYELYSVPTAMAPGGSVMSLEYPQGYYRLQPVYPYGGYGGYPQPGASVGTIIPAQWMLRVKLPHPFLRYDGFSPLSALNYHIDLFEMIDRSRHSSMRRGVRPSAVLDFAEMEGAQPLPETEIERMRAEWEESHQGPDNAGNLFVTPPGGRLEPFGARPADMDYTAGWDQMASFVLGGFGITKPAAGMIEDASYSTLFATMKQLYWQTLEPMTHRLSSQLTKKLAPFFGDNLIVEVRCKRIDDHDVKLGKLNLLCSRGSITHNELRDALDEPLTPEAWGAQRVGIEQQPGSPQPQGDGMVRDPSTNTEEDVRQMAERLLPAEISNDRPTPGAMGDGAMGPFNQIGMARKSLYQLAREVMRNGH